MLFLSLWKASQNVVWLKIILYYWTSPNIFYFKFTVAIPGFCQIILSNLWNTTLFSTDVRGFIFAGATPVKLFRAVYLCIWIYFASLFCHITKLSVRNFEMITLLVRTCGCNVNMWTKLHYCAKLIFWTWDYELWRVHLHLTHGFQSSNCIESYLSRHLSLRVLWIGDK